MFVRGPAGLKELCKTFIEESFRNQLQMLLQRPLQQVSLQV